MESMMLKDIDELRRIFLDTEFTPQAVFESLIATQEIQMVDAPREPQLIQVRKLDLNLRRIEF